MKIEANQKNTGIDISQEEVALLMWGLAGDVVRDSLENTINAFDGNGLIENASSKIRLTLEQIKLLIPEVSNWKYVVSEINNNAETFEIKKDAIPSIPEEKKKKILALIIYIVINKESEDKSKDEKDIVKNVLDQFFGSIVRAANLMLFGEKATKENNNEENKEGDDRTS